MKKAISIILSLCMAFALAIPAFAAEEKGTDYPWVLVHGMMGYGEDAFGKHDVPYWGYSNDNNVLTTLRGQGYEAYAPSVGPMSSAWDRACELYAQLTGTVVDYGAAHAAQYGHARYGRDYTGKGYLSEDWYKTTKINLFGHSFGGPTVMVFASLMYYGAEAEQAAAPDDCSPLFRGGYDCIFSVNTLEGVLNGSPVANLLTDTVVPIYVFAAYFNIEGTKSNPANDFMMDQWGLTADPAKGETAKFNLSGILRIAKSNDHAGYDMTLQGARALCEKFPANPNAYYFSQAADLTEENNMGMVLPGDNGGVLAPTALLIALCGGGKFGGIKTTDDWKHNDGLVPVPSALYPYGQANAPFSSVEASQKAVWYYYPVVTQNNHGYGIATKGSEVYWEQALERLSTLPAT